MFVSTLQLEDACVLAACLCIPQHFLLHYK